MNSIPLIPFPERSLEEKLFLDQIKTGKAQSVEFEQYRASDCYAVEVQDASMRPGLSPSDLAVFNPDGKEGDAQGQIFLVGVKDNRPLIRKVVKNESPDRTGAEGTAAPSRARRKSFMTPTPLHIPDSQVSPIPGSAHEAVFLKRLDQPEQLQVIPGREILWMHPLVEVIKAENK